jgi:pimeloyl-ACP methyl ester carboxylesterase
MPVLKHRFVAANGLRFHVAECGDGDHLALCLHGFPECWYSWRYQLPLLAQLGYRAWAPDLRGYGETERPPRLQDYAVERLLDDVAGLIDAAQPRSVVLVAHDWGAILAWYFAMRRLRPLERLVIMNVPHPAPMERELGAWRQRLRSSYAVLFQLPWVPERLLRAGSYRAIGNAFRRMAIDKSRFPDALTAMLNYYRAFGLGGGMARQRTVGYPVIEVPVLMIWGEADTALSKETTYGTEAYVRDLKIHYLPNVSHWVQQEAPEAVNGLLVAFLERRREGTED